MKIWSSADVLTKKEINKLENSMFKIFEEVGFTPWDCIVIKWHGAIGACFASQVEDRKICAKQHEYLVVGKKPKSE